MKKTLIAGGVALVFIAGAIAGDRVRDWHDLEAVHAHLVESIHEMERARKANHYDMDGHGAKAEELMHQAERELHSAASSCEPHSIR